MVLYAPVSLSFLSILRFCLLTLTSIGWPFKFYCVKYFRVGRTARAGRSGLAISLITPYDILRLGQIEDTINTKLTEYKIDGQI